MDGERRSSTTAAEKEENFPLNVVWSLTYRFHVKLVTFESKLDTSEVKLNTFQMRMTVFEIKDY